ncbi:MAG: family 78 glycoside hydrolase catalytic domain [Candidatus Lokiarchaeota archaeon]|nr:family 78 glycoside hydrolase catalytic domain [Candidatus Lokiarchaeota archaeon]
MHPKKLRVEYLADPLGVDVPAPRLFWILDLGKDEKHASFQVAYRIIVASDASILDRGEGDLWDSGKVESPETTHVPYAGKPLRSRQQCFWRAKVWDDAGNESRWEDCEAGSWQMGLLEQGDWHAKWIGARAREPRKVKVVDTTRAEPVEVIASDPSPMLRKAFTVAGKPARAVLYSTALGEYEVTVNGLRAGDDLLQPEWTDYTRRVQYQVHDVTGLLRQGENVIGAMLADGWYMGLLGPGDAVRQRFYGTGRRLLAQLVIETADGKVTEVVTDGSWKVNDNGPVQASDHFLGEDYDARLEQPGWDAPGFDDANWAPAIVDDSVKANLVAQKSEPVRVFATLEPVALHERGPGTWIFDLGQNMVGWCEVKLGGAAGQKVTLRHGEMLELDGSLHVDNLRLAAQTDTFVLDGGPERWFHPRFTFHGFKYVEVSGLKDPATADMLVGKAFSSDPPVAGSFECSHPGLNQLWRNILWTQRDNIASIPTDCPQRNERMGWTGDAQVFAQTGIYNMDMAAFYAKFTADMRDGQKPEGMYPDFAPHPFPSGSFAMSFGPGWGDAGIIIPWRMYTSYGDKRLLEEHYESMKSYIDLIIDENEAHLWTHCGSNYGDWLNGDTLKASGYPAKGGEVPKDVYATSFFALSSGLFSRIARIIGKNADAAKYGEIRNRVVAAFNDAYVDEGGRIRGDTQAGYAIALGFGLLSEENQSLAVDHLLDAIKRYSGRLSTGFISTPQMMLELSKRGHLEQAYKFAENEEFPGWLYTIKNGATTIWERWDGFVAGRGFQDKGMNSFCHYAIGAVGEWLYRVVLGIDFDEERPGMRHVVIAPRPGGSLAWAKGAYDSIRGRIASSWRREGTNTTYRVEIPPNVRATVDLVVPEGASMTVDGETLGQPAGSARAGAGGGRVAFDVPPGSHEVVVKVGCSPPMPFTPGQLS